VNAWRGSTALLVVDMQNGFCHPDGSFPQIGRGLENAMEAVQGRLPSPVLTPA
jgi:nicotinamidase-related amidase